MKKQSLIKGTVILGVAGLFAKFLGLFFRWPLIMLIGDEGLGYYQMTYPLYAFFIAIASGIPVAISKLVSERNAIGDRRGISEILSNAMILMMILGGGFSLFLLLGSKGLIKVLRWNEKSYYSIIGISLAPIFIGIMCIFRGYFQGLQNMNRTAVSQILEQLGRVVIGVSLAYFLLPRGIEYSAGGASFGAVAGGAFSMVYLLYQYKKTGGIKTFKRSNSIVMGNLLRIAIPISLGATVGTIMSLIDSILVPQKLLQAGFTYKEAAILYGQLTGKAFVLINVPLTLSTSLCTSIVPIIAEAYILKRRGEVYEKVCSAIVFAMVIALPCCLGLFFLSDPILQMIFPGHSQGGSILRFLSLGIPLIIISQTSTSILQGIGRYKRPVFNLLLGCIVKIIFTEVLVSIPGINIYGAVIGTLLGYLTASILNLATLAKTLKIKLNIFSISKKPAISSLIMIIAVEFIYIEVYNITVSKEIACLISILAGGLIYCIMIFAFGIFNYRRAKKIILRKRR